MKAIPSFDFKSQREDNLQFEIARIENKTKILSNAPFVRRDSFYVIFLIEGGSGKTMWLISMIM